MVWGTIVLVTGFLSLLLIPLVLASELSSAIKSILSGLLAFSFTPSGRSIATMMAVSGQMYGAIIFALLVGKFSSQSNNNSE